MSKFYKTDGLIFKIKNLGESDKLVWVLTASNGKISSVAKGIRKLKSKKAGHIDLFNYCKFSFHKGRNLDIMNEASVKNDFKFLKENFTYELFYIAELIDKITFDEVESSNILDLLIEIFEKSSIDNFHKLIIFFEIKLLKLIGFEPNLISYLDTEERFTERKKIYFSYNPGFVSSGSMETLVDPKIIKCQRFCISASADATMALQIDKKTEVKLWQINKIWIQNVLGIKFKSLEFIKL